MACPYFMPGERLPLSRGSLGDLYAGACQADAAKPCRPDETTVADRCNLGYARGRCAHFPEGDGPDAIRFSIARKDDSSIRVLYSLERDHRPYSNGSLAYSTQIGDFESAPSEAISTLAAAYVRSYLRRTR